MRKLTTANFSNILITADHGFIYQHRAIDETDFSVADPTGDEILFKNRRFVIGIGLNETAGMKKFGSAELGLAGDLDVLIPNSINRMRVKGAGSRFVHGGASLQEVIIPVTSSITSAIAIETTRRGCRYIPAHEILSRASATLAIPMGRQKLIPDQLFAIDYGGSFRSFVLEVDRGTEPARSKTARKSLESMLRNYTELWAKDGARRHYGLKSPLLILMEFTSPVRAARCLELIATQTQELAPFVLVQTLPHGFPRPENVTAAISKLGRRSGMKDLGVLQ